MISEHDVLDLWSPIFKLLIGINNAVRLKKGETVNPVSTEQKKLLYPNESNVKGFKIDFRILSDVEGDEFDFAAGEVAIDCSSDEKVIHDEVKLLRESKDIADRLADCGSAQQYGWSIQICGLEGSCSTTHLHTNGLYVAVHQHNLVFPKNLNSAYRFIDTLHAISHVIVSV